MKLTPFGIVYSLFPKVAFGNLPTGQTVYADSVTRFNAAVDEVNTNYADYGYDADPEIPHAPTVPDNAAGVAYFQGDETFEMIDPKFSTRYSLPDPTYDAIIANLDQIARARAHLDGSS